MNVPLTDGCSGCRLTACVVICLGRGPPHRASEGLAAPNHRRVGAAAWRCPPHQHRHRHGAPVPDSAGKAAHAAAHGAVTDPHSWQPTGRCLPQSTLVATDLMPASSAPVACSMFHGDRRPATRRAPQPRVAVLRIRSAELHRPCCESCRNCRATCEPKSKDGRSGAALVPESERVAGSRRREPEAAPF